MRIFIPTYRRTNQQLTYANLPKLWRKHTVFVCDERDAPFLRVLAKPDGAGILLVPDYVKTIAQKRAWLIRTRSEESILMLDDDLRFACRRDPKSSQLLTATEDEKMKFINQMNSNLERYAHAGFSGRGFAQDYNGWIENRRMMYALGYRPGVLRKYCELGRIETREDFDYTLQLMKLGFPNSVCYDFVVDQKGYGAKGGASEERTIESSNEDAKKLAELHPGLVRVVEKEYSHSIPRLEVVVSWAKAFKQSSDESKPSQAMSSSSTTRTTSSKSAQTR